MLVPGRSCAVWAPSTQNGRKQRSGYALGVPTGGDGTLVPVGAIAAPCGSCILMRFLIYIKIYTRT